MNTMLVMQPPRRSTTHGYLERSSKNIQNVQLFWRMCLFCFKTAASMTQAQLTSVSRG
jgi:hypothetical protein